MAAAASANAAPAAAPAPPVEVSKAADWSFRHDFKNLSVAAITGAARGTRWCSAPFTARGVEWRVVVMPNEVVDISDSDSDSESDDPFIFVHLELLQPDSTVELESFGFEVLGLGVYGNALEEESKTFSTKEDAPAKELPSFRLSAVSHRALSKGKQQAKYFPKGCLTVTIKIRAKPLTGGASAAGAAPSADPEHSFLRQLASLRAAGTNVDVTIRFSGAHAGQPAVEAHSFVLALRSPFFRSLFDGPMRASGPPYTHTAPEHVTPAALDYMYTDSGTRAVLKLPSEAAWDLFHAADYYSVPRILQLCEHRLETALTTDNVLRTLVLAHARGRTALRSAALRCASQHVPQLMRTPAWAELATPLRDAITLTVFNQGEPPADIAEPAPAPPPPAAATKVMPERAAKRTRR